MNICIHITFPSRRLRFTPAEEEVHLTESEVKYRVVQSKMTGNKFALNKHACINELEKQWF